MPNYTQDFALPHHSHKDLDTLEERYYMRIKQDPSGFFSTYAPCHNCICLPMCLNKRAKYILWCPIVLKTLYKIGTDMRNNYSTVVDIKYYDVLFWIHKSSHLTVTVELVIDNVIQCVSMTLDLMSRRLYK